MRFPLGVLSLVATAITAFAQGPTSRVLDRGSFTITVEGQRAGREDFSITGTPGAAGMEYLSRATVSMGDRRVMPSLWSDSTGAPKRYGIETRGTAGGERWTGAITRGRVSARISNARGPSEREYVVSEGAVILEDDVFHQYYFVVQRATGPSIPVIVPLRNRQVLLKVTDAGAEQVLVEGKALGARHLTFADSTGETREVWVDAAGRVLKVAIPARRLVALRDEPPAG